MRLLTRAAFFFNTLRVWRGGHIVWGQRMVATTFDRWLYLNLHRFGPMGGGERSALEKIVRPDMTVVDVGANLGLYTVLLSRLVGPAGRVIAFEPDPALFAVLQQNCALNSCANVTAHPLALGARNERLALHTLPFNSGDNHLGPTGGQRPFRAAVGIEAVALDEFASDLRPDLVKLDVQGWELAALRGMERTLAASPATEILLEFWPAGLRRAGAAPEALGAFLRKQGFQVFCGTDPHPLDADALAALARRLTGLRHVDLFASRRPDRLAASA